MLITANIPDIPQASNVLASSLSNFKAPTQKIAEMEKSGEIVRLKRGLFIKTSAKYNLPLIANHIYAPSYVSKQTTLRHYGLIPEHIYTVTSVCLNRFSEDMDFSLLAEEANFNFEHFFPAIIKEFEIAGRTVEITKKDKRNFGKVESAFLKDTTDVYNLTFQHEKSLKIKIEVDTEPPLLFNTEQKLLMMPCSLMTRCLSLPDLFAGKMHALVFRAWKNRVKGRDWYDFEWLSLCSCRGKLFWFLICNTKISEFYDII